MVHTHDTPTIKGYLKNHDLDLQLELGIIDRKRYKKIKAKREHACDELKSRYKLSTSEEIKDIFHKIILKSKSCISLAYLDDFTNEFNQLNLPGTISKHKNWSRKLSQSLEDIEIKL